MSNTLERSNALSFEEAITLTQSFLDQVEQSSLTAPQFTEAVANLVATPNGVRGFFVAYLTDARGLVDTLISAVVSALQLTPDLAPEFLIKNLAMSTAMEITHRRNNNPDQAAQSIQVQHRTAALITQLGFPYVKVEAEHLWQGLTAKTGTYAAFLQRWGYDAEQQAAIAHRLQAVLPEVATPSP